MSQARVSSYFAPKNNPDKLQGAEESREHDEDDDDIVVLDKDGNREPPVKRMRRNAPISETSQRLEQWRRQKGATPALTQESDQPVSQEKLNKQAALKARLLGPNDPFQERIIRATKDTIWNATNDDNGDRLSADPALGDITEMPETHNKLFREDDEVDSDNEVQESMSEVQSKGMTKKSSSSSSSTKSASKGKKTSKKKSPYTPLEEQWIDLKKQNSDVILAVEVGYKFKFFDEDAKIVSKELNIAHYKERNFFTAMVPNQTLERHIKRLIGAGFKVGVVRQMESAALKQQSSNKNAPFIRKLTEIYTISTWVDSLSMADDHLTPVHTCLVCLSEESRGGMGTDERVRISLLTIQTQSGVVLWDQFDDGIMRSNLETRLIHSAPSEIVILGTVSKETKKLINNSFEGRLENIDVTQRKDEAYSFVNSYYSDEQNVGSEGLNMLNKILELPNSVIILLAHLIRYLESFSLKSILSRPFYHFTDRMHMLLNANTVQNLEIYANSTDFSEKGSLFWVLNKTRTRFGRRLLRDWVGRPLVNIELIKERQDAVTEIKQGKCQLIFKLRDLLEGIPDLERGLTRILYGKASPQELARVLKALSRIANEFPENIEPSRLGLSANLLQDAVKSFPCIRKLVDSFISQINMTAAENNKKTDLFIEAPEAVQDCLECKAVNKLEFDEALQDAREVLKKPHLSYITVAQDEYLLQILKSESAKVPKNWVRISATKDKLRYRTPRIQELLAEKERINEQIEQECETAFAKLLASVGEQYEPLRKVIKNMATVDCLFSFSLVASLPGYSKPILSSAPQFDAIQARHPMIEQLHDSPFVPNDIKLEQSGTRAMILTGMNAGGKSSLAKTVALISIMGQIGCYVPADKLLLGVFDAVFTRMGATDNLIRGRSTFMVELFETCDILKAATERSFVVLDELGRGTSTHDGLAIAGAVVDELVKRTGTTTIAITHYPQLCGIARELPESVKCCYMDFVENKKPGCISDITFLYTLKEGIAKSHGLSIAKLAQLPESVLTNALSQSTKMEQAMMNQSQLVTVYKMKKLLEKIIKEGEGNKKEIVDLARSTLYSYTPGQYNDINDFF